MWKPRVEDLVDETNSEEVDINVIKVTSDLYINKEHKHYRISLNEKIHENVKDKQFSRITYMNK